VNPVRIAVFSSGEGTNFSALVQAEREGCFSGRIVLLVSDKEFAPVRARADDFGIGQCFVDPQAYDDRTLFDAELVRLLREFRIDLVVFAGYMRIATPVLVRAFSGRIVNIHPSLLPLFPGKDALGQALAAGAAETGVTVHWVDEGVDSGAVIAQERVPIVAGEKRETLAEKVRKIEHRLYPQALVKVIKEMQSI